MDDPSDMMAADGAQHVRRLRARKLAALSSREINPRTMRQLFRLCDEDGSHLVSPAEIQRGLVLLGFPAAKNPVALSRLVVDIDRSKTGAVRESEFLAFMSGATRDSLRERLRAYTIERCFVLGTVFGRKGGENFVSTESVPASQLRDWLAANLKGAGRRVWLDVCGYNGASFALIADAVGIAVSELAGAVMFQEPSLEMLPRGAEGAPPRTFAGVERGPRAKMVLHVASASSSPFETGGRSLLDSLPGPLASAAAYVGGYRPLAPGEARESIAGFEQIFRAPPAISVEQAVALCVSDRAIVTVRQPNFDSTESALSRYSVAAIVPEEDVLNKDGSHVQRIFADLRRQLREGSPNVAHLFKGSTKGLAVAIADAVLAHNFELRDMIQDWDEMLSADIVRGPSKRHSFHLRALEALAQGVVAALAPVARFLDPEAWDVEGGATGEERDRARARAKTELQRSIASDNLREKQKGLGSLEALAAGAELAGEEPEASTAEGAASTATATATFTISDGSRARQTVKLLLLGSGGLRLLCYGIALTRHPLITRSAFHVSVSISSI